MIGKESAPKPMQESKFLLKDFKYAHFWREEDGQKTTQRNNEQTYLYIANIFTQKRLGRTLTP